MKVIKPLFLDDLTASYQNLVDKINENEDKDITDKTRCENRNTFIRELESLLDRISNIKFLDPACGSGNFLIITYKEIRRLEVKILKSLRELRQDGTIDFFETSKISLNQFYGIELDDFAHEVARLSLWIAEYQMNLEAENEINLKSAFLPLRDAGNITQGNALRLDWNEILPHQSDDEIYLIGNPPYIGASLQSKIQKDDIKLATQEATKYGKMDYIAGWFFKGAAFINSANSKLAFVTTNSIFQGEQVSIIWKSLIKNTVIDFVYTSFKWGNSAANNAGVTVAIIALANFKNANSEKYIFDEHLKKIKTNFINAYLAAGENLIVDVASSPLNGLPKMVFGNKPSDGGHLNFTNKEEITNVLIEFPELQPYIKKYVGSQEYINGKPRMVLWLNKEEYRTLKHIPFVSGRVESVRESRLASKAEITRKAADKPYEFLQKGEWEAAYAAFKASGEDEFLQIVVPGTSSENRDYVPMGFVGEDTIISNSAYVIYNAPIWLLGLLESRMHMVWLRAVGGRLETRYRYSAGLVYNTFPVPELSTRRKNMIEEQVFEILDLREELGGTLAELYHKDTMPESLREAHKKLDEIVERAYKDTPFNSDEERLSHLLKRYKEMTHE
ncbi:Type II restriction enzyme, methylase subunit YeeA [Streptococcus equinus]|nr:DNA methyltransferase [Streptococcus equinus]VED92810.1 Type II restriction enzyme, methylase subunit YeeA [Streptococcus equinus]VTS90149.1 Type II restriction enzyme, methylase subunit YeeA [Streptococcus equinus]